MPVSMAISTTTTPTRHAIVADAGLLVEVGCWPHDMIVVRLLRADKEGSPHATYHRDGTRQVRSRLGICRTSGPGGRYLEQTGLPRLAAPIPDPVNVFAPTLTADDTRRAKPYDRGSYASILTVPATAFDGGYVFASVDIVEPGVDSPVHPWHERVIEADLPGTSPAVRVTIWKPDPRQGAP